MNVSVRQMAEWVRGEVVGDGEVAVSAARPLSDAGPGDITYVDGTRNLPSLYRSGASAAVVPLSIPANGKPLIRVSDPLSAFATIILHLRGETGAGEEQRPGRIDPTACIHPTAVLGPDVTVGPYCVIEEGAALGARCHLHAGVKIGPRCRLGDDVELHPNVVLYRDCVLGNRIRIYANSVIGAEGFGYRTVNGRHEKLPQLGSVDIGDDVEIGACSSIDRGTFGVTRIGEGTKIDNHVQVGHNAQIGRHNLFAAQVGIAGSVSTGDYVFLGGQSGVSDHIVVGEHTAVGAQCGVIKDALPGSRLLGYPARPDRQFLRITFLEDKLPDLARDVKRIKKALGLGDQA